MYCDIVIFVLCAVAITDISSEETARSKRQTFEIENKWVWGYYDESPPVTKKNATLVSLNDFAEQEEKPTVTATTTTTIKPTEPTIKFTSRLETKPTDLTTIETITNNSPIISTIEPTITNATSGLLAQVRFFNSTQPIDTATKSTIELKPTETTTVAVETTTIDICDPLSGKPDFSAPGRRINEAQCMGYVWELQNRIKVAAVENICNPASKFMINHAVGGRKTEIGEFPHMGALGWKAVVGTWVFKCGSTLISANFVLTAAHCAKASDKDTSVADPVPKIVRLGDKLIIDKISVFKHATDANISRIIVHPQYNPPMQYYDIALMELQEPVEFTRLIQPACLWNNFTTGDLGHEATLTGWGVIKSGTLDISPELQAATVNVLDTPQCDELLKSSHNRNWKGFQEHQLCAGKLAGGVDSCQGDSGGPLQTKMPLPSEITDKQGQMHYVIGIISFGVGCAHPNLPGIYTRVSSFIDWIEDNVWKNGNNKTFVKKPWDFEFINFGR